MNKLADRIREVFSASAYPGDDSLTVYAPEGRVYDEVWHILRGREWSRCPVAELMRCDTPLADLTVTAFHYYMPALLLACLEDECGDVVHSVLCYLAPGIYGNSKKYVERVAAFDARQREVIRDVAVAMVQKGMATDEEKDAIIHAMQ